MNLDTIKRFPDQRIDLRFNFCAGETISDILANKYAQAFDLILQIRPTAAVCNIADRWAANIKSLCQLPVVTSYTLSVFNPNNFNLCFCKLVLCIALAVGRTSRGFHMLTVAFARTPFEVLNSIIGSYAIQMVNIWPIIRIRQKCLGYQPMHCALMYPAKTNNTVAIVSYMGIKPSTIVRTLAARMFRVAPYFSCFRNCVFTFPTFYIFHNISRLMTARIARRPPLDAAMLLMPQF